MNYKVLTLKTFFIAAFIFFFIIIAFYLYDPFAFFHTRSYTKDHFHVNTKYGLRHFIDEKLNDFNSIILGTSMLRNTNGKWLENKNDKYINLSVNGFAFKNRAVVLRYILSKKELNNVVYSLDQDFFFDEKENALALITPFFEGNFKTRIYSSLSFYVSENTYWGCLAKLSRSEKCVGKKVDILIPNPLHNEGPTTGLALEKDLSVDPKLNLPKIFPFKRKREVSDTVLQQKLVHFKQSFLNFVARNPGINFSVIIPPYSRAYWSLNLYLLDQIKLLKMIIKEGENYQNLKFYYFQNMPFTSDWKNFTYDMKHYRSWVNKLEIKAIKNGTYLLNTKNLDKEMDIFLKSIKEYNIYKYKKYFIPRYER